MDIMSLFRGTPAAAPAPTAPTAQGPTGAANPGTPLPGTAASPGTDNNGMVPAGAAEPAPLDTFKDIWQTPANTPNPGAPTGPIFSKVDPKTLMESAGKVDFSKAATPEQLQAIAAGGQGAMEATMAVMNKVAQTVYAQSAFATTQIVDQAVAKVQESFDARLPTLVKKFSVNENLQTENPLLSNPALTPLVSALSEQLVRKNPNATSAEIQQQVNDYFAALGTTFAPKPPETPASRAAAKKAKDEDWSGFFE